LSKIALALISLVSFCLHAGPSLDDLKSDKRCTEAHDRPNAYDCMIDGPDGSVKKTRIFKWDNLPELADHPEWAQCGSDSECVNISYSCAGGTVNKKFAGKAKSILKMQNARRDCAVETPPQNPLPFKVFCKENKCGSQGRNPKSG
jgi:hypothetical protein